MHAAGPAGRQLDANDLDAYLRMVEEFEAEWAAALEESRRTFSLTTLYEVVRVWQARPVSAPAVDAFVASGGDESGFVDMAELRGRRRRSSPNSLSRRTDQEWRSIGHDPLLVSS
ncbi:MULTISPECIES: DUF6247 family protein [unclassified Streptomyces]|uniref:DUF6247 family protein n=1 Tax=unclassified Streptomyces TaxID=2593676 RepID=UPI000AE576C6|nr:MULTISPECIES: DUF6247 family protein [unclassified Streptomyces]